MWVICGGKTHVRGGGGGGKYVVRRLSTLHGRSVNLYSSTRCPLVWICANRDEDSAGWCRARVRLSAQLPGVGALPLESGKEQR